MEFHRLLNLACLQGRFEVVGLPIQEIKDRNEKLECLEINIGKVTVIDAVRLFVEINPN
jgi:hypothetical protein